MNTRLPVQFKILIGINAIISLFSLLGLGFYISNNVVSHNGVSVGPLKLLYFIIFLVSLIIILLLLCTKRTSIILELVYSIMLIVSGIKGNSFQIVVGIVIMLLIFNKNTLAYAGFIKEKKS